MDYKKIIRDLWWVGAAALAVLTIGLGLRDPWPADEPRFALAARDMVMSGNWLFPRIGGDLYADKPPLFIWLIASFYQLTGSLRVAFLLPSLLAALGTLFLVYDLGRRLWNREAGLWAALALLFAIQFTLQAKRAQIDMVLTFWTTLSLYGLLRYLLLGHGWRWWALGGFAAGLGVITKGVGFLPLLILLPYAYARWRGWKLPAIASGKIWTVAPLTFVAAIALWVVPMLVTVAVSNDAALAAYRDEILFHQTAGRYFSAWHHHQPFYYYLPMAAGLWLPLTILIPWLIPRWRERWQVRDARVLLPLSWILLILLFFSLSPGKRGVYIFPALPMLALVSGEWLRGLWQRVDVQRAGGIFAAVVVLVCAAGFVYLYWMDPKKGAELLAESGLQNLWPLVAIAVFGAVAIVSCGFQRGALACAWVLAIAWWIGGIWVMPQMNAVRSDKDFIARVESQADPQRELGLVAYKEQYLLNLKRPTVNFGHARWREGPQEEYDAARWLNAAPDRQLLVPESRMERCFQLAEHSVEVDEVGGEPWYLVSGPADAECARKGADRVFQYAGVHQELSLSSY